MQVYYHLMGKETSLGNFKGLLLQVALNHFSKNKG